MIIHEAASTQVKFVKAKMAISLPRRISELACKLGWDLHAPLLRLSYHEILIQITRGARRQRMMWCMVELSKSLRKCIYTPSLFCRSAMYQSHGELNGLLWGMALAKESGNLMCAMSSLQSKGREKALPTALLGQLEKSGQKNGETTL